MTQLGSLRDAEHLFARWKGGHDLVHAHQVLAANVVLVLDCVQLCLQDVVFLCEFDDALLQDHVVEAAFFAGSLCRFVVASAAIPIAVVFL